MSAGVIIVTKVGDPITWVFTTLTGLLSGVLFPVEYLPTWLQAISLTLPTTHALHALRMTLLQGASVGQVSQPLTILFVMTLMTVPAGLLAVRLGFNRARRSGTLAHY